MCVCVCVCVCVHARTQTHKHIGSRVKKMEVGQEGQRVAETGKGSRRHVA